jgi:hypothetical protein
LIDEALKAGLISEEQVIRPALPFKLKTSSKIIFVRPGIDQFPSLAEADLVVDLGQVSHGEWIKQMSAGKMPIGFLNALDHDLAHLTELMDDLGVMGATRDFYRRLGKFRDSPSLRFPYGQLGSFLNPLGLSALIKSRIRESSMYYRAFVLLELNSVPDTSRSERIRNLLPDHFATAELSQLGQTKSSLEKLTDQELQARAIQIIESSESLLMRQGGFLRDPTGRTRMSARATLEGQKRIQNLLLGNGKAPTSAHFEHLHAYVFELELAVDLSQYFETGSSKWADLELVQPLIKEMSRQDPALRNQKIRNFMNERLAIIETALANAIKLDIKPHKLIDEVGRQAIDPNSDSYRYFDSFMPEDSMFRLYVLNPRY